MFLSIFLFNHAKSPGKYCTFGPAIFKNYLLSIMFNLGSRQGVSAKFKAAEKAPVAPQPTRTV
jgi:hypothetical protein